MTQLLFANGKQNNKTFYFFKLKKFLIKILDSLIYREGSILDQNQQVQFLEKKNRLEALWANVQPSYNIRYTSSLLLFRD